MDKKQLVDSAIEAMKAAYAPYSNYCVGAALLTADGKIYSGYLEASNVSTVTEMVNLISISRQYESNQKIIQTIDSTLETAVTRIGKV